jgi:hypothetical protein
VTALGTNSNHCEGYATTRLRIDTKGEGGEREPTRKGLSFEKKKASEEFHRACQPSIGGIVPSAKSIAVEGAGQE